MKNLRYIVASVLAFVSVDVMAWTAEVNRAILMFAEATLDRSTRKELAKLLDTPLCDLKFENEGRCKTRLNEEGRSVVTDENDAVVRLEKAIATLADRESSHEERKVALLTAVELTVDIHCPANILIDKHLEGDFVFGRDNSRPKTSRWYSVEEWQWQDMWHSSYHNSHGAFSAEMYLYDWNIATKGMAKKYKKENIAPRMWAEQTGERVLYSLKTFQPNAVVDMLEITKHELLNEVAMYDAAFRLAKLLNETLN